jgi:glutamate synthase domain-containing protein 2
MIWDLVGVIAILLGAVVLYDVIQRRRAVLHNFPVIGHLRYILETMGPELRQYIVTSNDEERPFSRDQRRWVYTSAKKENTYFGFGSDNDMELVNHYLVLKHSAFPLSTPHEGEAGFDSKHALPCAKILGGARGRRKAFRPDSVINISAMSYGALGAPAVEALNRGVKLAGCMHNTGEGSVSPHHLHGGDLMFQIGTAYFGCRDELGRFDCGRLCDLVKEHPQIKALEIKLSQGAKPGLGGVLPADKVTPLIADIRGIPAGKACLSPSGHTAFSDADSLLDFVEDLAEKTGLPVGIKSAVGELEFWQDLSRLMAETDRGVDFITIDGGEGGTGAAPLAFTDHVALPFKLAFTRVYREFAEKDLDHGIVFNGSAKLGFPEDAALAFILGCDMISVAREAMLAIGCIQAQRCQTNHCPAGIATHNKWLIHGLDPTLKAARLANYVIRLRMELLRISHACGVPHPALLTSRHCELLDNGFKARTVEEVFGYEPGYGLPSAADMNRLLKY